MKKQSIVFLGSKPIGYYCFEYLIQQASILNIQIDGLLSNDNNRFDQNLSIQTLAKENNIPLIPSLAELPMCDFLISVQYHEILSQIHIDKAQKLALNLHMAPLPEYRGCNQFTFAILDQKNVFGTTIHKMDSKIDHGDIIAEKRFDIPQKCWVENLYKLTYHASLELFKESIASIVNNQFTLTPQKLLITDRGTSLHYRNEIGIAKQINLEWDKEKIDRHIRATYMSGFEPPYCIVNNEKIYFTKKW